MKDNVEEIIVKDMASFMSVKSELNERVFWRVSETQKGKVEIKLALDKAESLKILSQVKD